MMSEGIGGYFELELPDKGGFPHDDAVLLNSGRNALEYVLRSLNEVCRLWIPYYTCEVMLEPLGKLDIAYSFYPIDSQLELCEPICLQDGEYLLYTNYFGIKDEYVRTLAKQYGERLIVDNAQALFAKPVEGVNTVYSPRKYVGIPDGGIACCANGMEEIPIEQDCSFDRCSHLLKRLDLGSSEGYSDFKENSHKLCDQPIRRMSKLTMELLKSIDFEEVKRKRRQNAKLLHDALKDTNKFDVPDFSSFECPMVYPYLTEDVSLKQKLIENKVFVATYWPNVKEWTREGMLERRLSDCLIPIPCDQRYGQTEMNRIVEIVKNESRT